MTPPLPPLSVVIPSYRRADLLAVCLRSLRAYAPSGTEVLVVDDHSDGGVISRTARQFPAVRIVRLPRRRGFCVAANRGVALARAPVVELLNDDTEVTPGWADAALCCFADPAVGAVAPLVLVGPPNPFPIIDSAGDEYDPGGFARKRGHGRPYDPDHAAPLEVFGASASSAFYRREAILESGGFPEHFGSYFEDVDLSFRLRRSGWRIRYEPRSVVWHRVSASHGKTGWKLIHQQSLNEERVYWRNVRGARLRHLGVLGGKMLRRWQEGALIPWLSGRLQAWWEQLAGHTRSATGPA